MTIEAIIARGFQLLLALTGAYTIGLWFALIVWTFRDIESRSRSVIAQIFSTLVVVLFFIPGVLIYLLLRPKETLDEAFGRALEEEYLLQDLEDLSLCPNCHRPVQHDYVACPHCYTELRHTCPSCNRLVDVSWSICAFCTAELVTASDEIEIPAIKDDRPSILPLPLRLLRERTEVRLEHMLSPDHEGKLPDGQPSSLIARETQAAGAWTDDTGKGSWFLSRAREVFAPLNGDHARANGHTGTNGHAPVEGDFTDEHSASTPPTAEWDSEDSPTAQIGPPPPPAPWTNFVATEHEKDEVPIAAPPTNGKRARAATSSRELYSYRPAKRRADTEDNE